MATSSFWGLDHPPTRSSGLEFRDGQNVLIGDAIIFKLNTQDKAVQSEGLLSRCLIMPQAFKKVSFGS